jgi:signal transduction histidine kinase
VVTLLIPTTASCAPVMMVIPVIMAVPYLPRRIFQLSMVATIAPATIVVVAGGLPGVGLQEEAPEWFADLAIIELAVLNCTLALFFAWENQIGMAAQTRRLHESRRRIVAATERERQRIECDLHDGAQQLLVAAAIEARVAQRRLTSQPHLADETLSRLSEHVAEALTELRDLAHGIYPPQLAHGGLTEALNAATKRAPTPAIVYATDLRRHPPHVELGVYFCLLEALQNATKHAGETARVTISLTDRDGGLTFDVRDTGPGCDPATLYTGHGITNMHDRLTAIGGTLTVDSTPGVGVHIHGYVPAIDGARADRISGLTSSPA